LDLDNVTERAKAKLTALQSKKNSTQQNTYLPVDFDAKPQLDDSQISN